MQKRRPNIMLVGIQGSGKGTQWRKILEKFGYVLFDTGAELRKISKTETELGKAVKNIIETGGYVPSEYIRDTIVHFINTHQDTPILFDWPIRSKEQDKAIRTVLWDFVIIELKLNPTLATERLLERRVDPETGETFPPDFQGNRNPKTGNTLVTRKDDNEEAIKKRIQWSLNESLPLIDTWEKAGFKTFRVDANQHIDEVFDDISAIILSL